ncbi:hypothetical protein Acr_13g0006320 [Actinidia rufa]|uniref:Uncharacterized protein n=1 Tax=Actinidia rufa TaxID=165716 RepID=A0A7J0FKK4_9ERIC|nr:hypothetical protein Acr_13g0006320 [Actinidia rufa]
MTSYWDQSALMEPAILQTINEYVPYREKQRLVQFLMALRDQFKTLRGAILHRSPLPLVDGAIHKLITEETRLKVHHISPPTQLVFATSSVPRSQTPMSSAPVLPTPASHLAPTSSDTSLFPSFVEFQQFQQYRAFMATIQGDSTQASAMTTTHLAAPVAKENLTYLDPFPSDVSIEEYSFTLDITDIPLSTTSLEVSDYPPPPATSSLPSLIPPVPLVYSRRRVVSLIPSSSSMAPSFDYGNPDLLAHRYPTRSRHPLAVVLQIGFQPSVHDSTLFVCHLSWPGSSSVFSATDGVLLEDPTLYRELVGCLVYLTIIRPDISYVVHVISQYVSAPRFTLWAALLRILRYVRGTLHQSLLLSCTSSLTLRAYADVDWAGDISDQIVWLHWLLSDMDVPHSSPMPLYCDNTNTIQIAHNFVFHERTKHIEIDDYFVRQHLQSDTIALPFVSSTLQLIDFFTKTYTTARFRFLLDKLSMLSALVS